MERDEAMPCVPDLTKKRTSERERERETEFNDGLME